jgi:hypothetical protein
MDSKNILKKSLNSNTAASWFIFNNKFLRGLPAFYPPCCVADLSASGGLAEWRGSPPLFPLF